MKSLLRIKTPKTSLWDLTTVTILTVLLGYVFIIYTAVDLLICYRQINDTAQYNSYQQSEDRYRYIAAMFATAAYVRDWDDDPALFFAMPRTGRGDFFLQHPGWECSVAFSKLTRDFTWLLYFTQINTTPDGLDQDTQILTGSRLSDGKPIFVVAFRGSDKLNDYLYTNFRSQPIEIASKFNEQPATRVHRGFAEQALSGFQALVFDPVSGRVMTVREAMQTYPEAEMIVAGHSAGGGTAQVFTIMAQQMQLNTNGRIHTRTFAPAGALLQQNDVVDLSLDAINYFIPGDLIFLANHLSGYMVVGTNVILPPSKRFNNYTRELHEMTTYMDQLREFDTRSLDLASQ